MTNEAKITKLLEAAWDLAERPAVHHPGELAALRDAFERHGLQDDGPVLVESLSEAQKSRVVEAALLWGTGSWVLATGKTWVLLASATAAQEVITELSETDEDAVLLALGNSELTPAQEAIVERSIRMSIAVAIKKVQAGIEAS